MAREQGGPLDIAYLHYGAQSGVTAQMTRALLARGHQIKPLSVPGPLEPRDPVTRRLRPTPRVLLGLACGLWRYGARGLAHRWNTPYAFDVHSARASRLLSALPRAPDVVLQNGALFAPGAPPPLPYVLLLDHTRALSMQHPPSPASGLPAPLDYGPGWKARETAVYRGARAIATFSRHVAESLQRDYGVDGGRVHVVGAGANVYPEVVERRHDGHTLLFVGKDFCRKGGPVLLRAFSRLRRHNPRARLLIAGPTERLELPRGAMQLGFIPPERMGEVFAQATAFVLPTLREPFGLAFLDAMACGLPCVGTAVEAVPEIVEHGVTGLLVPAGDEGGLARALADLLSDPARGHAMGLRGRLKVDGGFRWHQVADRLEAALRPQGARLPAAQVA